MGTKTDEAAGAKDAPGTEDTAATEDAVGTDETADAAKADVTKTDVTKADAGEADAAEADAHEAADADDTDDEDDLDDVTAESTATAKSSGVGEGAAAVVAAALGVIGLSGGWLGTVAGARSNIMGQLEMQRKQSAGVADQLQALYGDSWQSTALIAGIFALGALVIAFVVLAKPAFGTPGKVQAPWIKSVAWAGLVLGVIGLILAIAKYSDLLLGLPSVPS
ncbi:hypothetical protein [Streptomyces kanamyceticus]|uniref:Uncharacterized protein n=1 Tax=Streptomyces kanamyceticus TaxID=1967 RepID=A0A5J6GCQ8_STRKN|nr:hypothetical protein [Streptomyces kanamyceticus]QEU91641.1 hypothetical protein CP970_12790 [Streptomyces kanamyceticus]